MIHKYTLHIVVTEFEKMIEKELLAQLLEQAKQDIQVMFHLISKSIHTLEQRRRNR